MDGLAAKYAEKMSIFYMDVDDNEELAEMYEVTDLPTFLVLEGPGPAKSTYSGSNVEKISEWFENNM